MEEEEEGAEETVEYKSPEWFACNGVALFTDRLSRDEYAAVSRYVPLYVAWDCGIFQRELLSKPYRAALSPFTDALFRNLAAFHASSSPPSPFRRLRESRSAVWMAPEADPCVLSDASNLVISFIDTSVGIYGALHCLAMENEADHTSVFNVLIYAANALLAISHGDFYDARDILLQYIDRFDDGDDACLFL